MARSAGKPHFYYQIHEQNVLHFVFLYVCIRVLVMHYRPREREKTVRMMERRKEATL